MGKTILILGGGTGGVVAANLLRNRLGSDHRIVLLDNTCVYKFEPSLMWLMVGKRTPEQITRNIEPLKKKGIEVIKDEAARVNTATMTVETATSKYPYDYLVIATGARLSPEEIPGFDENAFHVWDLAHAIKFRDFLPSFKGGKVLVGYSRLPYKCPPAPFEAALLLDHYFREKGIRDEVDLQFFCHSEALMPFPDVSRAFQEMLEKRNIPYTLKFALKEVDGKHREIVSATGERIPFDMLFAVPPHRGQKVIEESGLANTAGWIEVDRETLKTKHEGVYAIGDCTALPVAKSGGTAHFEAEVVANNIAADIKGGGTKVFDGRAVCVVEVGGGKGMYLEGHFYAQPPEFTVRKPRAIWHWSKILFEKYWLWKWF